MTAVDAETAPISPNSTDLNNVLWYIVYALTTMLGILAFVCIKQLWSKYRNRIQIRNVTPRNWTRRQSSLGTVTPFNPATTQSVITNENYAYFHSIDEFLASLDGSTDSNATEMSILLQFNVLVGAQYTETPHTHVVGMVGHKTYIADVTLRNWYVARKFCERRGYDLATFTPDEKVRFTQLLYGAGVPVNGWHYWTGGRDLAYNSKARGNDNVSRLENGYPVTDFVIRSYEDSQKACLAYNYLSTSLEIDLCIVGFYTLCEITKPINRTNDVSLGSKSELLNLGFLNGTTYFGDRVTRTWKESENFCQNHGMQLAVITNRKQIKFLMPKIHLIKYDGWYWVQRNDSLDEDIDDYGASELEFECPSLNLFDEYYFDHNCSHKHFTLCEILGEKTTNIPTGRSSFLVGLTISITLFIILYFLAMFLKFTFLVFISTIFLISSLTNAKATDSDEDSESDPEIIAYAKTLRKAIEDLSRKRNTIHDMVGDTSMKERIEISKEYNKLFDRNLEADFIDGPDPNFGNHMAGMFMSKAEFQASEIRRAITGYGTDEDSLSEILCCLKETELQSMKKAYNKKFKGDIESDIKEATSNYYQQLLLSLLNTARNDDESDADLRKTAVSEAVKKLNPRNPDLPVETTTKRPKLPKYISFKFNSNDEGDKILFVDIKSLVEVFSSSSFIVIRNAAQKYQTDTGHKLQATIHQSCTGDFKDLLINILEFSEDNMEFYARKIHTGLTRLPQSQKPLIRSLVMLPARDQKQLKKVLQFNAHVGAQYEETPHTIVIGNVGEKAFIVDETLRSWDSSLRFCEKRGFDFLTIAPEELDGYYQFMNVYDSQGFKWRYWLGAKDLEGNGNFTWVKTGTPVSGLEIHSWRPDDEDEQDFLSYDFESSKFYKNTNNPYYYTLCESTTPINSDITHKPTPESKSGLINLGSLDNITYFGDMVTRV
ncbi:unnamed protein product [Orchesella dallaii]|uniref:C-type lectin domain-containing protein n=1 Tax=Orchesella dallaii TaxID=48710 RepID=A0ABP1RLW2_9HEXA